ncbi:MAG TPA: hypothetical protein VF415_00280, partial [Rhodanobacter sp.]
MRILLGGKTDRSSILQIVEKVLSRTFSTQRVRYTPGPACADSMAAPLNRGQSSRGLRYRTGKHQSDS